MVAPVKNRRVVCHVVRVSERPDLIVPRRVRRPSALLPWADPYIAGLVERLQNEVRRERTGFVAELPSRSRLAEYSTFDARGACRTVADLEPPCPGVDADWDAWDRPQWSTDNEPTE
jgi:hypothetical protein